ncbi:multicopper oxidase domain-containing protein [Halomonas aquatica]|uniref:Multicopper oxidase domain-containing protein n=1 Tax=Halomonas aquatica TaxID=3151123 RepID=A0ABV1NHD7_9GAMM
MIMRTLLALMALFVFGEAWAESHGVELASPMGVPEAVQLGRDLDGDGDADEVDISLEIIEVQEEVYPGEFVTFWVFAPEGRGMVSSARTPSPTIRVEQGDRVRITLRNTHYFPHTIHLHGTIHPNEMDGVPVFTQPPVNPGEAFTYEFIATNPGTHFYHCHVQPDVHVPMGLVGMLIIEPNRPDNEFARLIPGAGRITELSQAAQEHYQREYSLVYMDIDARLNRIPAAYHDPREIEQRMHREYDSTQHRPNIFLLNGRAFPYTLRDSLIEVDTDERVKLRVLNAGARTMQLHTHGHHPVLTHLDGYPLSPEAQVTRDVFTIGAAQRVDLELRTGRDDTYASGPGVWLMHDHVESTVSNKGISPGGDITAITYEEFVGPDGLPKVATSLDRYFDPAYYRGEIPVFDPEIFHTTPEEYAYGWSEKAPIGGAFDYVSREATMPPLPQRSSIEGHRIVADACEKPRGFRRIRVQGGTRFSRAGEVFAFEPRVLRAEPCEEVEIVFENVDAVRHALMLPGLNPMFTLEFTGPDTQVARFVTPDRDITLDFHCHVETHDEMGMHGRLIIGEGGQAHAHEEQHAVGGEEKRLHEGRGVVVAVDKRASRFVIDHEEIPGLMAPMVMSYQVEPASLLQDVMPGGQVRFTIDATQRTIIDIVIER